MQLLIRLAWRLLALCFVGLGLLGVVLPGMPTTVFMLLAVWAASKGWPPLADWLINHPRFGPPIQHWQQHRAIPRRAKWLAGISMFISMPIICFTATSPWIQWLVPGGMCLVLLWLCTRPEPPCGRNKTY
ncbi:YbaN family protein [Halopseudomonas sabulinigri]|uniref:Inner membrane protein n=1 Tax=Halopseudomonas sabulinigri TaxID=472181 RepID=A0ABP9ZQX3_9GAMM